jgi:glycerol kinase
MAEYVGAIDQGTTSSRFMAFNHSGGEVGRGQHEFEQILPQAGHVEHDPAAIWTSVTDSVESALHGGISSSELAAVGVTNQRETTVVWNPKTGEPYYNAIVWQDTRNDRLVTRHQDEGHEEVVKHKAGLPIATYFSGGKLQWLFDNVDGLRAAAQNGEALFGNTDTWVLWNLTGGTDGGVHITDVSNASRTMLMNLETLDWDDELCELFGVPRAMLPEIRPSSDPNYYGVTRADGPFGTEIPLCGDLGDQQAATVGQVCYDVGDGKNTYGTGNFMLLNTGTEVVRSDNGLLTTLGYKFGDDDAIYCLEGAIAVTGSAVQWLRDQLGIISDAPLMIPSWSRSHWTADPVTAIEPSSA